MPSQTKGAPAGAARRPMRPATSRPRGSSDTLHAPPEPSPGPARLLGWAALGLTAALSAALLAMALGPHRIGDYFTETDFYGAYAKGARLIQHGQWLPARYGVVGPGYEAALALAGLAVRDLFLAAELLSIVATAATLWLWFDLLRRRFDPRAALAAALFLATNRYFFHYGYAATTDALAMGLQALALWLLLARGGTRAVLAAGVVAALAFLTRYNAVYLLPAGLVAIAGGAVQAAGPASVEAAAARAAGRPRRRLALLFAAGFLAPVLPWVLYSLTHGGSLSLQLHHNIAYEVFARSRGIAWDDYQRDLQPQFHNLWDVIRRDPPAVFRRMAFNVFDHLAKDARQLLGWPVALSALLGLLVAWRARALGRLWPMGSAAVLLFLSLVPAFYSERYSLPLAPMYAMLAGAAFGLPALAFPLFAGRLWGKAVLALVPLALAASSLVGYERFTLTQLPVEVLDSATALRAMAKTGDKVIARKPHLSFHAGVEPLPFPFANTIPELADYAHKYGARWLFVSWPEVETRPRFWHLLDTTGVMPGLVVRHVTHPHPSVLYEIGPDFGRLPAWYTNDTIMTWHNARATLMVTPQDTKALFSLALVERARGHMDEANRVLEQATRIDPKNVRVLLLLGEIALGRNDAPRAEALFRRALDLEPANQDAVVGLGWSSLLQGRLEEAAQTWRPVVGVVKDPTTLARMVQLYSRLGDAPSAQLALSHLQQLEGAR